MQKINHQNYDLVFKEAFSIFNNKSLDFLGVDLPSIASFMEREIPEVETTDDMMDLNFRLEDGSSCTLRRKPIFQGRISSGLPIMTFASTRSMKDQSTLWS